MAITSIGLEKLGFNSDTDFIVQDDGSGPYISKWNSASPQPTEAEIEEGHRLWDAEQIVKADQLASAKSKLEALGLTVEEIKEAFGI